MQNKCVRFAVVGCGHIGKRHAEMITRNPKAELVALADTASRHTLGLDNYHHVPFFSSAELMLQAPLDIDVVVIATPNGFHAPVALHCLNARKHVVIEKPMALSREDAEMIVYKALSANRHVFSVMQNRYSPPSSWLKEVVAGKLLGDIYQVQINCFWNRDERYYKGDKWHGTLHLDGGTLFTQFSHFIDIMYWIFGDIYNITSRFASHNHTHLTDFEDSGIVNFDFLKGGMGAMSFTTSVWDRNMESSLTVIAEKGALKIGGQYMNEVEYCHIKDYTMPVLAPTNQANDYGAYKGSAANHHYIVENVVNVLNGDGIIGTNAFEGLKVVDIIERIYKSSNTGNQKENNNKILYDKPSLNRVNSFENVSIDRIHKGMLQTSE